MGAAGSAITSGSCPAGAIRRAVGGRGGTVDVDLGWHVIAGDHLLDMLTRVSEGEDPDMVFAELWANAEHVTNDEEENV